MTSSRNAGTDSSLPSERDDVEDVAVEEELGGGSGAEQVAHLGRPAGQLVAHWLSRARASGVSGGGSVSRSSIAP